MEHNVNTTGDGASKSEKANDGLSPWFNFFVHALWPLVAIIFLFLFRSQIGARLATGDIKVEAGGQSLHLKGIQPSQRATKDKDEAEAYAEDSTETDERKAGRESEFGLDHVQTKIPSETVEESSKTLAQLDTPTANQITQLSREGAQDNKKPQLRAFLSLYHKAEDMALRLLQSEYGVPIQRQVTGGSDQGFDGVFYWGGKVFIVEVKYFANSFNKLRLQDNIRKLVSAIDQYKWTNAQIILVAVFQENVDRAQKLERLMNVAIGSSVPVTVRVFTMADLEAQFGIFE